MNTRQRGCLIFIIILIAAVVGCGWVPFVLLPSAGIAVGLPIIEVPGEVLVKGGLFGLNLTNTMVGTFLADIWVLVFAFAAWRVSRGWTKEVPGRFQSWVEWFLGSFYGFMRGIGGERLRTAPLLWPLVATIFLLLLAGNWLKLLPGVETVGKMHCSHVGSIGYPLQYGATEGTYTLYVSRALDSGERQTPAGEHACESFFYGEWERYPAQSAEEIEAQIEQARVLLADAELQQSRLPSGTLSEEQQAQAADIDKQVRLAREELERQEIRLAHARLIPDLERQLSDVRTQTAQAEAAEAAADDHGEATEAAAAPAVSLSQLQQQESALAEQLNRARTQVQFPTATLVFDEDQLASGAVPFLFHITPFVRGMSTDLSLTFMLAILAIVCVQIYGVWALGPAYFEKFVNISALGNMGKKPMGAVDFLVGLIEIISEIGKIVSLAFRLFGNLFAGGVALIALTFLVALFVPMVMYLLEIIIGTVQALVFAVLTLVFVVQAMESHHSDDHAEEAHH